ncbi:MAG: hypothetical protein R2883_08480 [Caldisericia bacterium]
MLQSFLSLSAEIIEFAASNDGNKINTNCGATHPETVAELVKENDDAIAGFSPFDGDGDDGRRR